ncbi:MAG: hypothetical protein WC492_03930 [Candidatus Micrarchaeia archaeon]
MQVPPTDRISGLEGQPPTGGWITIGPWVLNYVLFLKNIKYRMQVPPTDRISGLEGQPPTGGWITIAWVLECNNLLLNFYNS